MWGRPRPGLPRKPASAHAVSGSSFSFRPCDDGSAVMLVMIWASFLAQPEYPPGAGFVRAGDCSPSLGTSIPRELFSIRALISSYRAGLAWAIYDRPIRRLRRFILPFLITEFAPRTAAPSDLPRSNMLFATFDHWCFDFALFAFFVWRSGPSLGVQGNFVHSKSKRPAISRWPNFSPSQPRERKLGAVLTAHQFSNSGYCANVDGKVK